MTDTYLQPEVHIIITQTPGVDGITNPARLTQIETDLATVMSRPAIYAIDDIPDVSVTSATDGDALLYNSATSMWEPGATTGAISQVDSETGASVLDVSRIFTRRGITVVDSGFAGVAYVQPIYGTGANTVAEGRHAHALHQDSAFPFAPSGVLSSGTRTLVSDTVSGLDPTKAYLIKGTIYLHLRGDGTGASYALPKLTINGVSRDQFEEARSVAGVMVTEVARHTGVLVAGLSSVAVGASVSFQSGDPSYISAGVLVIEIFASR